jgi:hypothetical protein
MAVQQELAPTTDVEEPNIRATDSGVSHLTGSMTTHIVWTTSFLSDTLILRAARNKVKKKVFEKQQIEIEEARSANHHWRNAFRTRRTLPFLYLAAVVWLNAYICRELFFIGFTGYMNSMHGIWIAIARLAPASYWLKPGWWPFWQAGAPFDYVYAPLVPGLTALGAWLTGWPAPRAFYALSGLIYCLLPGVFFLVSWQLTRAPGYSFAAAIVYSLTSPTELIVPDFAFHWSNIGHARRLYMAVVWDEIPHLISLTFVLLVVLFLYLSFQNRRSV